MKKIYIDTSDEAEMTREKLNENVIIGYGIDGEIVGVEILNPISFDIDDDANFQQTIDYVNNLSSDELASSYKDLKNPDGTPFYDAETIAEFERTGYIPKGGSMTIPGLGGSILNKMDKPLTKDELLFSLNEAEEVGKTGGGAMDWQERMKKNEKKIIERYPSIN